MTDPGVGADIGAGIGAVGGGIADRLQTMPGVPQMWVGDNAPVGGMAGSVPRGDAPPPGGGQGFRFEPDQIDAVIGRWKELRDQILDDEADAQYVAGVRPPGKEFASGDFAEAGTTSGETLLRQKTMMADYIEQYIAALEQAKGAIQNVEDDTAAKINQTGAEA